MRWFQLLIASLFAFLVTRAVGSVTAPAGGGPPPPRRRMVRCASCGVYVLEDRALPASAGTYLCSTSCAARR
jgi:hypothetical protein